MLQIYKQIITIKVVVKPTSGCVLTACSQLLWVCQVWNKWLSLCYKVDDGNRLTTSCSNKTNHWPCDMMITTCSKLVNNWEQAVLSANTYCWEAARFLRAVQMMKFVHIDKCTVCLHFYVSILFRMTKNVLIFYKTTRKSLYYY
jgi:hypothetical protein